MGEVIVIIIREDNFYNESFIKIFVVDYGVGKDIMWIIWGNIYNNKIKGREKKFGSIKGCNIVVYKK